MSKDAFGNDLAAVGIPLGGFLAVAPRGTTLPTPAAGAALDFELSADFRKAGLITEDGGFEWTLEADGDPIVFFQEGYSIPTGLATADCVVKLAQYDDLVRELAYGKEPDANGFITIDAGGHADEFVIFTAEVFKNGVIRRRVAEATVKSAKVDKAERGSVNGTELTFSAKRHPALQNEHIGEWLVDGRPAAPADPAA